MLLAGAVAAGAGWYGAGWPGFRPVRVAIVGNRRVPAALIARCAAISPRENLWLQNMHAAASRVKAIPDILDVAIHRRLPARVTIAVSERVPYARVVSGGASYVVDRAMRVLDENAKHLPAFRISLREQDPPPGTFLTDAKLARLRTDYDDLQRAHVAAAALQFDRFGDLTARTPRGITLLLGDDESLREKASLVAPILAQTLSSARPVSAIDLRAPNTPVVVYAR